MFASHPPSGLRARLLENRPARTATVTLDQADNARIDAELRSRYDALRRHLAAS
jgi:hypothetical protein